MVENLKALAIFAKTVEAGSFRAAARALQLSPSVVSHHVSELERRVSAALLYRTTRRLSLTSDGERLYRSAREVLEAAERGFDELGAGVESPAGRLRITAPAIFIDTRFSADVAAFAAAYPRVSLTLLFSEQRHDLLRDGLDLAIRLGRLDDSSLRVRRFGQLRRLLVASPAYVAARPKARTLADLARWDLLQLTARPPELTLVPPGKRRTAATLAFTPRCAADSATALRALAIAGLGVTTLPELIAREAIGAGQLVEVLRGWTSPPIGVFAVWPGGSARPGLTMRFIEFMESAITELLR